jgi:2-C-methyl-D-erythritol 4-phosphate cytidylyltransferase/2-C-methyl-D-erythritol 2,4-cyclodiphosphate synthase
MAKTSQNQPFHVIIPAAGSGQRVGGDTPKQYRKLGGKSVLRHTVETFLAVPGIKSVQVVISPEHERLYNDAVAGLPLGPAVHGGKTRKESVYKGLKALPQTPDAAHILVHDAARPMVSRAEIENILATLRVYDAATLAAPMVNTLRHEDGHTVDRTGLWSIQTPQGFQRDLLNKAHEALEKNDSFTDDAGMVEAMGYKVHMVPGSRMNFKITTEDDFIMAEKLMNAPMETRTGNGFDVHAFDPSEASFIRLGGIDIPHSRKLLGHSDADVVLHALTDALLGTISAGDIGAIFPPSDLQWKGADSEIFLKEAARLVEVEGGVISHCDLTILCEAPKIGPHRDAMQARIGGILGIAASRVSIKATTTEGLGFTGRKEGIAAQAVCTVRLPVKD